MYSLRDRITKTRRSDAKTKVGTYILLLSFSLAQFPPSITIAAEEEAARSGTSKASSGVGGGAGGGVGTGAAGAAAEAAAAGAIAGLSARALALVAAAAVVVGVGIAAATEDGEAAPTAHH